MGEAPTSHSIDYRHRLTFLPAIGLLWLCLFILKPQNLYHNIEEFEPRSTLIIISYGLSRFLEWTRKSEGCMHLLAIKKNLFGPFDGFF